jgi:hypothetical protein
MAAAWPPEVSKVAIGGANSNNQRHYVSDEV